MLGLFMGVGASTYEEYASLRSLAEQQLQARGISTGGSRYNPPYNDWWRDPRIIIDRYENVKEHKKSTSFLTELRGEIDFWLKDATKL